MPEPENQSREESKELTAQDWKDLVSMKAWKALQSWIFDSSAVEVKPLFKDEDVRSYNFDLGRLEGAKEALQYPYLQIHLLQDKKKEKEQPD